MFGNGFPAGACARGWFASLLLLLPLIAHAVTTQYYYDDLGRIVQATRSDGSIYQYQYDSNGNVLAINRISASTVSVSGFEPALGHVGATVSIFGSGFSTTVANNQVRFGTVNATITSATATKLIATVPTGAVTAPISVTVSAVTATSPGNFIVRVPTITSFTPGVVASGGQVTVSGQNLNLVPGSTTISVGSAAATISSLTNTQAVISAPTASGSGNIQVATSYGNTSSATPLMVLPAAIGAGNVVSSGNLVTGGQAQININQAGKYGLLTFAATAGQYYTVQISSLTMSPSNGAFTYTLYSPTNTVVGSGSIATSQRTLHLPKAPVTGTYLLAVLTPASSTIQFTANLELDTVLSTAAASTSSISTTFQWQSRRFVLPVASGERFGLGVTGATTVPASGTVYFDVMAPAGTFLQELACGTWLSGCQQALSNLTQVGTYTIIVKVMAASTFTANMTLSPNITGTLAFSTPVNLNLAVPGQQAAYTFTATAGQTVAVNATSITSTPANKTMWVNVYNAANTLVGSSGSSQNCTVNLPNLAAGTYTIFVFSSDGATATAQVTLAPGVTDTLLSDGVTRSYATTVKGQQAYFTFAGTAGDSLGFAATDIVLTPVGGQLTFDVTQPNGNPVGNFSSFNCFGGNVPGCQLSLRNLPVTGTYKVVVSMQTPMVASFKLTLSTNITAALAFDTPTNVNLAVPGRHASYTFTTTAGQTIAASATNIASTPANKTFWVAVYNAANALVGQSGGSQTATANIENLPAGTYTLLVNSTDAATATAQVTLASALTAALPVDGVTRSFANTVKGQNGYFTFSGTAGDNLGFAATDIALTPAVAQLSFEVKQPNGNSIGSFACHGSFVPGCQLRLANLPATGTYRIVVTMVSPMLMSFKLTLSQNSLASLAFDTPTAVTLGAPGQYAQYTFTTAAVQTVALSASSFATTPSGKTVWVYVYNSGGTVVGNSGGSSSVNVNLPNLAAGTYKILIYTIDGATGTAQVNIH